MFRFANRFALLTAAAVLALTVPLSQGVLASGPQSYIVVLKDSAPSSAVVATAHGRRYGASVTRVYGHALKGYAARLDGRQLLEVRGDSAVAYIVPDGVMTVDTTEIGATWGLDRIDQHKLPLTGTFTYTNTGAGVTAYVLDTGIRLSHVEFGGRATSGWDFVDNDADASDCNGHGTHVAGTIGGATYGVAKAVALVAVRVLDCGGSGATSGVIAGIDFVTAQHQAGPASRRQHESRRQCQHRLGPGPAQLDRFGRHLCGRRRKLERRRLGFSPARVGQALTVGASTSADAKASFSNWGPCMDWFAPGQDITSAWDTGDTAVNTISGTSMASPHTAGAVALYLQSFPSASPASVDKALASAATRSRISGLNKLLNPGTPNLLLFTNR